MPREPRNAMYRMIFEQAARICEQQAEAFLSPEYGTGQPFSSIKERFACKRCARAIREAAASWRTPMADRPSGYAIANEGDTDA
jgi:hypothetical protein